MNNHHITEERMLEVLDHVAALWTPAELNHLRECRDCSGLLNEYTQLYPQLSELPVEALPLDFSQRVLAHLPQVQTAKKESGLAILWLGLGMMSLGLLIGMQAFYGLFSTLGVKMQAMAGSFGSQLEQGKALFGVFSPNTIQLIVFSLVTLASLALLDHFITRKGQRVVRG